MSAPPLDHDAILNAVMRLPRAEQIALAREILRVAEQQRDPEEPAAPRPATPDDSWMRLVGALDTGQAPPTDEDIERWRDERRMDRYGR